MTDRFAFFKRNVEAGGDWTQMETRDALPSSGDELDVPSDELHEFAIFDQKNGHSTAQFRQGNGIADVFDTAVAAYAAPGASATDHDGIITARRVSDGATRDFSVFDVHSGTLEEWADGGDVALALNDASGNGNDTSAASNSEEPLIVKSGVLVSAEERPALTLDGSDDSLTATVSIGDTITVAIDFESAHAATYPATVYSHDGLTVRETATDVEVEITDGTNTKTVTEPKLALNRVVVTATPSNIYVRVNGEESSASHSITRNDNSTLDLGAASFEGRVGHAVVYDGDRWADRDGLVQGMGGLYAPPERVRWDFGKGANQQFDSEGFSAWTSVGLSTVNTDVATDPVTGSDIGDQVVEDSNSSQHGVDQQIYLTSGQWCTWFDVRADGRQWARIEVDPTDGAAWFDLLVGTVGTTEAGVDDTFIIPKGDGVYRCAVVYTLGSDGLQTASLRLADADGSDSYTGDGSSAIVVFRGQTNEGARPKPYEKTGAKPQSIAPDVGPSKFAFSVGSDDTAPDTNDPDITPNGVKGDGTDDYLTLTDNELNPDRDFTWVMSIAPEASGVNEHIVSKSTGGTAWSIFKASDDDVFLTVAHQGGSKISNKLFVADGSKHTLGFSIARDGLGFAYSLDGGATNTSSLPNYYKKPSNDTVSVLARADQNGPSTTEVFELEHIPRALTDRELRAACRAIDTESEKRNSFSRVYPTYAWDFQVSEDNVLWETENLADTTYWPQTEIAAVNEDAESRSGMENWDEVVPNTNSAVHYIEQSFYAEQEVTAAIDAKPSGYDWVRLVNPDTGDDAWFDVNNGTVGTDNTSGASIESVTGGYRCKIPFTPSGSTSIEVHIVNGDGVTSFSGDGSSGVDLSRPQVNDGSSSTPYVTKGPRIDDVPSKIGGAPTIQLGSTSGADTNDPTWTAEGLKGDGSDDYATVTDASLNPASDFSWVARLKAANTASVGQVIALTDGTDGWELRRDSGGNGDLLFHDGGSTTTLSGIFPFDGSYHVIGFALDANGQVFYTVDGEPVQKADAPFTPVGDDTLNVFSEGGTNAIDAHVTDLPFYNTALGPNALLHETKELLRKRT